MVEKLKDIDQWLNLCNKMDMINDIHIHPDHLSMLTIEEIESWIMLEEHMADYYNYFPIRTGCNGIRFDCTYVNINKKSDRYGKLFRLTSFLDGSVDVREETYEPYLISLSKPYNLLE